MSREIDLRRPFQVGGDCMSHGVFLTVAELAVIEVIAYCESLPSIPFDFAGRAAPPSFRHRVRNGKGTKFNKEQPWAFTAHARTAARLEERGFVSSRSVPDPGCFVLYYELTPAGQELAAAIVDRRAA